MSESRSYIPKHNTNDLVMVDGVRGMCKVHQRSQYSKHGPYPHDPKRMLYEFYNAYQAEPTFLYNGEDGVRPPTFREFLWYRDPEYRHWKIGNNTALNVLLRVGLALMFIVASLTPLAVGWWDPWLVVVTGIGVAVLVATLVGTFRNWKGKQM